MRKIGDSVIEPYQARNMLAGHAALGVSRVEANLRKAITGVAPSDLVAGDRIALWQRLYEMVAAATVPVETYVEPAWLAALYGQAVVIAATIRAASKDRIFSSELLGDVADLATFHAQIEILGHFQGECYRVGKLLGYDIVK